MSKVLLIIVVVLYSSSLVAQESHLPSGIQRDTSFTLDNTATKVIREYPFAKLVESAVPSGVRSTANIVYAKIGNRALHLDLFAPRTMDTDGLPCVLLIHGGGWRSGYRQMEWPMAQQLAAHGYVAATVEYRLSGEAQYPGAIYDLKAAIRWMRAHAKEYNVDRQRIAVYGCSAGGELAVFLGTTGELKKFEGDEGNPNWSSRIQAVIDIDGILDFTDPAESAKDADPQKPSAGMLWFGGTFNEKPGLWKEASPINYVDGRTAPILFINSSQPRFHAGRDSVIAMLGRLGIYAEVHTIPGTPHPFWLFHPWFEKTLDYILLFLDKTLK